MFTLVAPISLVMIQVWHVLGAWLRPLSYSITDPLPVTNLMQAQAESISPPATWAPLVSMTTHGRCSHVPPAMPRSVWKLGASG